MGKGARLVLGAPWEKVRGKGARLLLGALVICALGQVPGF